jgi:hypothetical protein
MVGPDRQMIMMMMTMMMIIMIMIIIRRMHSVCWITKATDKHPEYVA